MKKKFWIIAQREKQNAPEVVTVEDLKKIPEKSIIWYPAHSDDFGGFMTKRCLVKWIQENPDLGAPGQHSRIGKASKELVEMMDEDIQELSSKGYKLVNEAKCELDYDQAIPLIDVSSGPLYYCNDEEDYKFDKENYSKEDWADFRKYYKELQRFCDHAEKLGYKFFWMPYSIMGVNDQWDQKYLRAFWFFD